jgi:hypothetical protein
MTQNFHKRIFIWPISFDHQALPSFAIFNSLGLNILAIRENKNMDEEADRLIRLSKVLC